MPNPPEHIPLRGFGLANFRSFGEEGFLLENPSQINVIIGKNNCGKSNVLRAIDLLRKAKPRGYRVDGFDDLKDFHRRGTGPLVATVVVGISDVFAAGLIDQEAKLTVNAYREFSGGDAVVVKWDLHRGNLVGHPLRGLPVQHYKI